MANFPIKTIPLTETFKTWIYNTFANKEHTHSYIGPTYYITNFYKEGSNWYKIYNNNWVEQGGIGTFRGYDTHNDWVFSFALLIPMQDTDYNVSLTLKTTLGGSGSLSVYSKTTEIITGVYDHTGMDSIHTGTGTFFWEAKGYKRL